VKCLLARDVSKRGLECSRHAHMRCCQTSFLAPSWIVAVKIKLLVSMRIWFSRPLDNSSAFLRYDTAKLHQSFSDKWHFAVQFWILF
jgi:hypothetical protein